MKQLAFIMRASGVASMTDMLPPRPFSGTFHRTRPRNVLADLPSGYVVITLDIPFDREQPNAQGTTKRGQKEHGGRLLMRVCEHQTYCKRSVC
jgi:hypothetical protein